MELGNNLMPIASLLQWFFGETLTENFAEWHRSWFAEFVYIFCNDIKTHYIGKAGYIIAGDILSLIGLGLYLFFAPAIIMVPFLFAWHWLIENSSNVTIKKVAALPLFSKHSKEITNAVLIMFYLYFVLEIYVFLSSYGGIPSCQEATSYEILRIVE